MIKLSKHLRDLEAFLLSDAVDEDTMLLSQLDGFLAGIIVCPDLVMPSEWMPVVWAGEPPVYESMEQAQAINALLINHYNTIIGHLDQDRYQPIYDIDTDDSILWEPWLEGFWQAVELRPDAWSDFMRANENDADVQHAMFILGRLAELSLPGAAPKPMEMDADLQSMAPDLLPHQVEVLHRARLAQRDGAEAPAPARSTKVGRNDPCPCGSGKKFKKCCLH
jgi:uncharacterized protein